MIVDTFDPFQFFQLKKWISSVLISHQSDFTLPGMNDLHHDPYVIFYIYGINVLENTLESYICQT